MSDARDAGFRGRNTCGASWLERHHAGCPSLEAQLRRTFAEDKRLSAGDPICPHCLHADECWTESFRDYDDGHEKKLTCSNCDGEYLATMVVSVRFMSESVR